ncbi:MAG TPA: hypothetical protein VMU14_11225, partial [Acidimicrobiales bacterium]|nr:hypothetical protein [Acidimicrobiales bacterium]
SSCVPAGRVCVARELATWREMLRTHTGAEPRLAGSGSTWFVLGAFPSVPGGVVVRTVCPARSGTSLDAHRGRHATASDEHAPGRPRE